MKEYNLFCALGIAGFAVSRTYTGTQNTIWLVYSGINIGAFFIWLLLDILTPDKAKQ